MNEWSIEWMNEVLNAWLNERLGGLDKKGGDQDWDRVQWKPLNVITLGRRENYVYTNKKQTYKQNKILVVPALTRTSSTLPEERVHPWAAQAQTHNHTNKQTNILNTNKQTKQDLCNTCSDKNLLRSSRGASSSLSSSSSLTSRCSWATWCSSMWRAWRIKIKELRIK